MIDHNSYKIAIARKTVSAPVKQLVRWGYLRSHLLEGSQPSVLDYGCGKGLDADFLRCGRFDPHYFSTMPEKKFQIVLCTFVLNAVPEETQRRILDHITDLLIDDGNGMLYLSLRRELPNVPEEEQIHRLVTLPDPPFRYFHVTKQYRILYATQGDLLKSGFGT